MIRREMDCGFAYQENYKKGDLYPIVLQELARKRYFVKQTMGLDGKVYFSTSSPRAELMYSALVNSRKMVTLFNIYGGYEPDGWGWEGDKLRRMKAFYWKREADSTKSFSELYPNDLEYKREARRYRRRAKKYLNPGEKYPSEAEVRSWVAEATEETIERFGK
jgi:hypothetical protein